MGFFTPAEAEALAASTVRVATLVDFDFKDQPVYVWNGYQSRVFEGRTYIGCGDLGTIDGLQETRDVTSSQVTFTLSGVPDSPNDILAIAIAETDKVQGRLVIVRLQLFDQNWNPFARSIPIFFGLMQQPRVTRESMTMEEGARRTITLPAENLFYGRSRPAAGRYTDAEQQQRFPGDLFCQYTPQLVNMTLVWPDY